MFRVVIPARYAASRLPGKPLLLIGDRPMIQWVWERACDSGAAEVVVATDDERIRAAVDAFGADCVITAAHHASGTDRVAEVARLRGWLSDDVVVNVQGDEPLLPSAVIAELAVALADRPSIDLASAVAPVASIEEFLDPGCVKALRARDGRALYFSRAPVPWPRDHVRGGAPTQFADAWRHVGLYAFRVRSLLAFAGWAPTRLEIIERLEQLRALEHGMVIHLVALCEPPPPGVDTPEDLQRVRAVLEHRQEPG